MAKLILLNKPFNVLCQFTDPNGRDTLANYVEAQNVYPAGRLDYDSEGLMLLTDNGQLQQKITSPKHKMTKTYWVQVEGEITAEALMALSNGVDLKDGRTLPAEAQRITEPEVGPRHPPVRKRKAIATSWLELTIREGRNRQVRRMTAAVGFPTLRLIRYSVGLWTIAGLVPGTIKTLEVPAPAPANYRQRRAARHGKPKSPKGTHS
jgi:23S rRNA pseudouridine2457 synthase